MTLNVMLGNSKLGLMLNTGQTVAYNSKPLSTKGLAKSYTVLTAGQYSGSVNIDLVQLGPRTDISFDGPSHTITCAGQMGDFKTTGGDVIVVTGSASNDGTYTTASATANTIVMAAGLTTEVAGASISIAKRESHANGCALDNNTGLMWNRTWTDKVGNVSSNGSLPFYDATKVYSMYEYVAAANAALLSGYNDWRVPDANEMAGLRNLKAPNALPDATAFPSISTSILWTQSTDPADTTKGLCQSFNDGSQTVSAKTSALRIMLVRAG